MSSKSLKTGEVIGGRFEIKGLIGAGGYGQVFKAEQTSIKRVVALKVLHMAGVTKASTVERFQREAKYACRLDHPNTVITYDFGRDTERDIMFLAMEFLNGEALQDRLEEVGQLSLEVTAEIIGQICGSLDEAHSIGLVHRDIKPANIMLIQRAGQANFVKVIDFGIAKLVESGFGTAGQLTATGMMIGSPHYMSPEQIKGGQTPIDGRSDVYSVACLTYRMLTGVPPFDGETGFEVATAQLRDPPPLLTELAPGLALPSGLQDVLFKALSKRPDARHESMIAFWQAFERTLPRASSGVLRGDLNVLGRVPHAPSRVEAFESFDSAEVTAQQLERVRPRHNSSQVEIATEPVDLSALVAEDADGDRTVIGSFEIPEEPTKSRMPLMIAVMIAAVLAVVAVFAVVATTMATSG